ncbi:MAG: heparinase II/III family protein, partial [Lentisphaerae bacterium]|nr:heparinase II/III family protein [Lentisphaerota bacterium]
GLKRLKWQVRKGPGRALLAAVRRKIAGPAREILECANLPEKMRTAKIFWPKPGDEYLWGLPEMALAGRLGDEPGLVEAVRRVFIALPALEHRLAAAENGYEGYYMPPLFLPLAYDLVAETLADDERRRFVEWAVPRYILNPLNQHRGHHLKMAAHNMTLGGMEIALATRLAVQGEPGAPDLSRETEELLTFFKATLHVAIGPDGYPEEDMGYGTVVGPQLAQVAEMLRRAGLYDAYRECPRFSRFGQAMLHFVQPWGDCLSNTGDHGDQLRDREFVLARLATETRDPSLLWLLGRLTYMHGRTFITDLMPEFEVEIPLRKGFQAPATALSLLVLDDLKKEQHPRKVPTAFRDRGRGIVTFRSGWNPDDTFVVFDGAQRSPGAPGHFHDSCGHFSLSALGEFFAIDSGRYNIEQNCHNVVLVNGRSGRATDGEWVASYFPGRLTEYRPDPFCDFAAVDSSHQHNCCWAWRSLGLVKGDNGLSAGYAWVVDDINVANDWADFWWTLNTSPENEIHLNGESATIRGWRHGNGLDVHFALPAPGSYPKPHTLELAQDMATPSSYKYCSDIDLCVKRFPRLSDMLHGPVFQRPRLIAKIGGYNGRILALLIPRRKGGAVPVVERVPSLDNSFALQLTFPKVRDTLIYAYEHHLLEAGDVKGVGAWCVVRRERRTGKVLRVAMGDGTALSVAGRKVR